MTTIGFHHGIPSLVASIGTKEKLMLHPVHRQQKMAGYLKMEAGTIMKMERWQKING